MSGTPRAVSPHLLVEDKKLRDSVLLFQWLRAVRVFFFFFLFQLSKVLGYF